MSGLSYVILSSNNNEYKGFAKSTFSTMWHSSYVYVWTQDKQDRFLRYLDRIEADKDWQVSVWLITDPNIPVSLTTFHHPNWAFISK